MRSYETDMRFASIEVAKDRSVRGGLEDEEGRERTEGRRWRRKHLFSVLPTSPSPLRLLVLLSRQLNLRPGVHEPSVVPERRRRGPGEGAEVVVEVLGRVAELVQHDRRFGLVGI